MTTPFKIIFLLNEEKDTQNARYIANQVGIESIELANDDESLSSLENIEGNLLIADLKYMDIAEKISCEKVYLCEPEEIHFELPQTKQYHYLLRPYKIFELKSYVDAFFHEDNFIIDILRQKEKIAFAQRAIENQLKVIKKMDFHTYLTDFCFNSFEGHQRKEVVGDIETAKLAMDYCKAMPDCKKTLFFSVLKERKYRPSFDFSQADEATKGIDQFLVDVEKIKREFCLVCDKVEKGIDFTHGDLLISSKEELMHNNCSFCRQHMCPIHEIFRIFTIKL